MSGFQMPFNRLFFLVKLFFAVLLSGVMGLSVLPGTAINFTEGEPIAATRREYKFDNSSLLIGGYNFDLSHADAEHVSYVKEAGIDFLVTSVNENFLDLCDEYGVGVIAKNYRLPTFYWDVSDRDAWLNMTEATLDGLHDCIWGNDLIDEPRAQIFSDLNAMAQAYYDNTEGLLPYINLFPIYANEEQLGNSTDAFLEKLQPYFSEFDFINRDINRYKKHVSDYINQIDTDYISVDIYPLGTALDDGTPDPGVLWLRNLDILAEACRETDRDLWVITQAAGNTEEGGNRRHNDDNDLRWQSYVSLSFGAKAIIHACYDGGWWDRSSHLIDAAGERTETYYAAQTVNNELAQIADIYGDYYNHGAFLVNKHNAVGTMSYPVFGYLLPVGTLLKPNIVSADPILVGCFTDKKQGNAYTFVNMSEPTLEKDADALVTFDGAEKITVYERGIPTVYRGNAIQLSIASRDGVFVTVE